MISAVIFDLDGLLVDSEPCWDRVRQKVAAEFGQTWTRADQHQVMGVSTATWADYMIKRLGLAMSRQEIIERVVGEMQSIYHKRIPFFPGAVQAVHLAARYYSTGLASGSERSLIDVVVHDPVMKGKFQAVVCTDDMPHGKPAPDVYCEAARLLGASPEACICVEDSPKGILAGKAAQMKVIAVPDMRFSPDMEVVQKADVMIKSLGEFTLDLLNSL